MSKMAASRLLLSIAIFLLCVAGSGFAQSNAKLWGTVTDSSGAVVAGANLVVRNQATGTEYNAKTNDAGTYEVPSLQVGTYQVQARNRGMQTETVTGVVLDVGQTVRQDFRLNVGQTTTEVTVSAEAPVIARADW